MVETSAGNALALFPAENWRRELGVNP